MSAISALTARVRLEDRDFWLDPHPALAEVRAEEPVFWHEPGQLWVLTKYDDIRYAALHPDLFSNVFGSILSDNYDPGQVAAQLPECAQERLRAGELPRAEVRRLLAKDRVMPIGGPDGESLMHSDPPRHDEIRRPAIKSFLPRAVVGLTGRIEEIVDRALDRVEIGAVTDVVAQLTAPIPAGVVAHLLGIPENDLPEFLAYATSFIQMLDEHDPERLTALQRDVTALGDYLTALLDARARLDDPGDDVVGGFVRAEREGVLSRGTALNRMLSTFTAGNETTRHLLSGAVAALAERPDQRALLRRDPARIGGAVEELLRFLSPNMHTARTATRRVTLRGRTLDEGDFVLLLWLSGNRDEEIWERPHELDVSRPFGELGHLAFGWGTHHCLGNSLARLEAQVFLRRLLARFPDFELAGEPVRVLSTQVSGFARLPVRFVA
jgi:cytochrome P450